MVQYFEGDASTPTTPTTLVAAVHRIMTHADERAPARRCAPTPTPPRTPPGPAGSAPQGIGLCRTEHMFLGERRQLVEHLILADTDDERQAALDALLPLQRDDFVEIFDAMDGLPVTDPADRPAAARVPARPDRAVGQGRAGRGDAARTPSRTSALLDAVRRLHEQNPMLGLRGVRLGLVIPGLFAMQVRAIAEAAAELQAGGRRPAPGDHDPAGRRRAGAGDRPRARPSRSSPRSSEETGVDVHTLIGTMIEVPRAALTAGQIAEAAEFFSFGTNDLTQMTWGFSRDDVEGAFFCRYLELGIFGVSPFESIDRDGVGRLVRHRRRGGPGGPARTCKLGVCGEHGGDPDSVHFFHEVGLDYVSCSPFRVPVARLEAGRAALSRGGLREQVERVRAGL